MNIARFKDAAFMNLGELSQELILVGGVGGIGSATVLSLGKSLGGIPTIYILDNDRVESHNIGTQFFNEADVGNYKVYSLQSSMLSLGIKNINPIAHKYDNEITPIMISAFDNMEARKQMFNIWKNSEKRELFIDGRLRANLYEVYIVTKGREEEFEKTLFDDADVDDGPCTFKQTFYFSMLIGARITHAVINYLTNKYSGEDICNLPFKIQEVGEPFLIKTEFL